MITLFVKNIDNVETVNDLYCFQLRKTDNLCYFHHFHVEQKIVIILTLLLAHQFNLDHMFAMNSIICLTYMKLSTWSDCKNRDARWPIYQPFLLKLANFRRRWPEEKVRGQKYIIGQFQTIVAKEIFIWLIGQFVANFRSNFIFCHVYFT